MTQRYGVILVPVELVVAEEKENNSSAFKHCLKFEERNV